MKVLYKTQRVTVICGDGDGGEGIVVIPHIHSPEGKKAAVAREALASESEAIMRNTVERLGALGILFRDCTGKERRDVYLGEEGREWRHVHWVFAFSPPKSP